MQKPESPKDLEIPWHTVIYWATVLVFLVLILGAGDFIIGD